MENKIVKYIFIGGVLILVILNVALIISLLIIEGKMHGTVNVTVDSIFSIPIKTVVPIKTTVNVPVTIPILGQQVNVAVPIDTDVPINTTVQVPIKTTVPVKY
ncbi:MAG: hypothetical protein ABSA74_03135 [Candidatus Staskawiczbacteria bacterium]|jgi:hypothetical protein